MHFFINSVHKDVTAILETGKVGGVSLVSTPRTRRQTSKDTFGAIESTKIIDKLLTTIKERLGNLLDESEEEVNPLNHTQIGALKNWPEPGKKGKLIKLVIFIFPLPNLVCAQCTNYCSQHFDI